MRFYFVDSKGSPVVYNAMVPDDAWVQSKGQKQITVIRSSCWMKMGKIGGVVDVPELTEVQIQPSAQNNHTIGVKYTVKRGDEYFTGFGSSNEYSVVKNVHTFQNNDGTKKEVVSGNALHAFEMAVKRAKVAAIAAALGFEHGEAKEIMESVDYIIYPHLRALPTIEYASTSFQDLQRIKHDLIKPPAPGSAPAAKPQTSQAVPTDVAKPAVSPQTGISAKPAPAGSSTTPTSPATSASATPPAQAHKQPQSAPPSTPKPQTPPAESIDNPGEMVLNFGEFNGKALITVLGLKPSYIEWLAKEARDPKIKAAAAAVLAQHPNLSTQRQDVPATPNTAKSSSAIGSRNKLRDFWQSRGYDPKNEVKKILSDALNNPELSWNGVTEEDAAKLYEKREILFPPKNNLMEATPAPQPSASAAPALDNTQVTDKECAQCKKKLYPIEITLSESPKVKEKSGGALLCFEHINVMTGSAQTTDSPKCKKCNKVLSEQELEFISKYGGEPCCINCQ